MSDRSLACACVPSVWVAACLPGRLRAAAAPTALQQSGLRCNRAAVACVHAVMSRPEDIAEQQRRVGAANKGQFVYPGYAHMDFVWDRSMAAAPDIVATLWKHSVQQPEDAAANAVWRSLWGLVWGK